MNDLLGKTVLVTEDYTDWLTGRILVAAGTRGRVTGTSGGGGTYTRNITAVALDYGFYYVPVEKIEVVEDV